MNAAAAAIAVLLLLSATACSAQSSVFPEIFPPPPADECVAPAGDGSGLTPVVAHLANMVPLVDFLQVFFEALSNDEDVVQSLALLQGEHFGRLVYKVDRMPAWRNVIEYFCEGLGFHTEHFLELFGYLFDVQSQPAQQQFAARPTTRRRTGLVGLFLDIADVMPLAEMKTYALAELQTNEYVQRAVAKVRGPEFKTVSRAIQAMPEFRWLKVELRRFGVDVECVICMTEAGLGWVGAETCVCEGV